MTTPTTREEKGRLYVVMGTTGEYSDRSEWPVRAFLSEDDAKALVLAAEKRAHEIAATYPNRWNIPEGANEHDPRMQLDYTGTSYFYYTVPFASPSPGLIQKGREMERARILKGIRKRADQLLVRGTSAGRTGGEYVHDVADMIQGGMGMFAEDPSAATKGEESGNDV